jgi:hypothetical protein
MMTVSQMMSEMKELALFFHGVHDTTGVVRTKQKSDADDVLNVQYIGGSTRF